MHFVSGFSFKSLLRLGKTYSAPARRKMATSTSVQAAVSPATVAPLDKSAALSGPNLSDFIANSERSRAAPSPTVGDSHIPYVSTSSLLGENRKVFFETYGCQMNVNDTEIARSVLSVSGYKETRRVEEADVVLLMTCAIREGAEQKIWNRIEQLKLRKLARARTQAETKKKPNLAPLKIGILGCMAERLKQKIIEQEPAVDLIAGPDAYRDLPRMLAVTESGQTAVNVILSLDETYADITPVRVNQDAVTAFVSIMRGCDNMCAFCIVPFTRGRERSRPIDSIVKEIRKLSDQGVKEVTLLGQNVNSYRDLSESAHFELPTTADVMSHTVEGFKTVYRPKLGGRRFADLLDQVSMINPEMRIRFTSPHPKDFPDEVLNLIKERPNICRHLHMPAQSGNNAVLESMRRGYTREAYLQLVQRVKSLMPDISLSSDFIAGFCGETEEAHQDTLWLIAEVGYQYCFCFPYSMREKTKAYRQLVDDVPEDVKRRRTDELHVAFRQTALNRNRAAIGSTQLILIEGRSKRSANDLAGRNDSNVKVIVPNVPIEFEPSTESMQKMSAGDYVVAMITEANSQVLKGVPLYRTTLQRYHAAAPLQHLSYAIASG